MKYNDKKQHVYPTMEFHISKNARDIYDFDRSLYQSTGNVIFPDFYAVRLFVQKMNEKRDLIRHPERTVRAGEINAMGLIDEIMHYMVFLYREQVDPKVLRDAVRFISEDVGTEALDNALLRFVSEFPPLAVYRGEVEPQAYIDSETEGVPNRELVLEELLMLYLANDNPGFKKYDELFDDASLEAQTSYNRIMEQFEKFFDTKPSFGPNHQNLIDLLKTPARRFPHSLTDQLTFIREQWSPMLGRFIYRLLTGLDFLREEQKMGFGGPGPQRPYEFGGFDEEIEGFSPDKDWMPNVILLAKSVYVWLYQLSKTYQRNIHRLDQIPDEELDTLASRGFTGLWLIGLWERSPASRTVKQICGNPEAEASAYSITAYDISQRLGGWDALHNLKNRCWQRGIRMASDMVPNHTGIDSDWVTRHPDWFIQLPHPPYPAYTYTGVNLSRDPQIGIQIEDHYYDRTDAAVTFKWERYDTGERRYIYHGNDGTSMPWNDTAQINFLHPEAREAVIQTILHVARHFPVIRFDAAMTLAKRHYQRLWFPEPGSGGDIPSRAEQGMTKEEFNRAMPKEFWREVVDRIAEEAPDTLLLAEAFWMMEGYFVRSLGMHRVYNSAFMNMLKDEENSKYRQTVKNTIEFDPGILNRYVNFMNNPDEETAEAQFGKGDKYFGICMMMTTMPGLPMFGHGQIEGYTEKYGMEYSRAYKDEDPDWGLVDRHYREIFPLMKKRRLFAGADNFLLYDLTVAQPEDYDEQGRYVGNDYSSGYVDENVFAYSNSDGGEHALVLFNNRYESTQGWIFRSSPYAVKDEHGNKRTETRTLAEGLGVYNDPDWFTVFREHRSGLHYIRNNRELCEKGLYSSLGGYAYQVFMEFRLLPDTDERHLSKLAARLAGAGFDNLERALKEIILEPVHSAFAEALPVWVVEAFTEFFTAEPDYSASKGQGASARSPGGKSSDKSATRLAGATPAADEGPQSPGRQTAQSSGGPTAERGTPTDKAWDHIHEAYRRFLREAVTFLKIDGFSEESEEQAVTVLRENLIAVEELKNFVADSDTVPKKEKPVTFAILYLRHGLQIMPETVPILVAEAYLAPLRYLRSDPGSLANRSDSEGYAGSESAYVPVPENGEENAAGVAPTAAGRGFNTNATQEAKMPALTRSLIDELWMDLPISRIFRDTGIPEEKIERSLTTSKLLVSNLRWEFNSAAQNRPREERKRDGDRQDQALRESALPTAGENHLPCESAFDAAGEDYSPEMRITDGATHDRSTRSWESGGGGEEQTPRKVLEQFLKDSAIGRYLQINRYRDTLYFNRENYYEFIWWVFLSSLKDHAHRRSLNEETVERLFFYVSAWSQVLDASGYRVDRLLELLR